MFNINTRNISSLNFLKMTPEKYGQYFRQGNLYSESIFSASNQEEEYYQYSAKSEMSAEDLEETAETVLDEIYNNEDAKKIIDLNHDGVISDEEKAIFEKYVKGTKNKLETDDLKKILDDIKNGNFNYDLDSSALSELNPFAAFASKVNNFFGGGFDGGGYKSGGVDQNSTHDVKSMSLSQLEAEQSLRENNYSQAQAALNAIYNGTDEAVAAAQQGYEQAEADYAQKVQQDNEQTKQIETQRAAKSEQIASAEGRKDEISISINDTEGQITEVSNSIDACEANISALQSAMDSYNTSVDSDDPDAAAAAEMAKAQIAEQISQQEEKKAELENQKTEYEAKLSDLNQKLADQEKLIGDLNKEYQEIEQSLFEVCSPETKTALLTLDRKKAEVGTIKSDRINEVKKVLDDSKASLDEVNTAYNDRKAKSDAMQYRNSDPSKVVEYVRELISQNLNPGDIFNMLRSCKESFEVDFSNGLHGEFVLDENGNKIQRDHLSVDTNAYCGEFAFMSYVNSMGIENMPEWLQTCYYRSAHGYDVAGRGHEVDIHDAKPGDLLTYDWNGDGKSDHVAIFAGLDDNGNVISVEGNTEYGAVAQCRRRASAVHGCYSV